jgi:hypothetical protein
VPRNGLGRFVEDAALAEQRVAAGLAGAGLEQPVHAESRRSRSITTRISARQILAYHRISTPE